MSPRQSPRQTLHQSLRHGHSAYWAFWLHRLSGLGLTLFLPLHFYVLALAIDEAARLNSFLAWSQNPSVKLAESGLVLLLVAHMTGGLRLLALEFLPWSEAQKSRIIIAIGIAVAAALLFLLQAIRVDG
jgi:fumarate reductase subunit D